LLDPERGGVFSIAPAFKHTRVKQIYVPETNVLLTRFMAEEGVVEVTDFMPITKETEDDPNRLVRIVTVIRGEVEMAMRCAPRFDYARRTNNTRTSEDNGIVDSVIFDPASDTATDAATDFATDAATRTTSGDGRASSSGMQPSIRLSASVALEIDAQEPRDAIARFTLTKNASATFVLNAVSTPLDTTTTATVPPAGDAALEHGALPAEVIDSGPSLHATIAHWRRWNESATYKGRYRESVNRSALVLKLLSSHEHGAIIAAATFGLPETTDGERRWDYRYVWIRDAAFSVYALLRLGHVEEANRFVDWISARTKDCEFDGRMKVMYSLRGDRPPEEEALPSLADGHAAQPPLLGNAATDQLQFDIYGALMDAIYLVNKYGKATSFDGWQNITKMVDYVADHWREPDAGIWEFRDAQRELLHSRLMCWVTVDRALRLAGKRSLPAPRERWRKVRSEIYHDIFENFWNEDLKTFVQSKGSNRLDAAALMMPLVRFIAPKDPRWLSTLDAISEQLLADPLVYRYPADGGDGLDGNEGAFVACSFWYAEALARAGRVDEGRLIFEKMLGYANHLGLFSEEVSAAGESLGNFPQCLSHLALISAAYQLDRSLDRVHTPWQE
jgi:GH15 family glucan-1,4-alpha-glucosidase